MQFNIKLFKVRRYVATRSVLVKFILPFGLIILVLIGPYILSNSGHRHSSPGYSNALRVESQVFFKVIYPLLDKMKYEEKDLVKSPAFLQYIHQSWKSTRLQPRHQKWSSTWQPCFPKAKYILWTDKDNRKFIKENYNWFLKRYDGLSTPADRASATRYIYMFHFGGLYTDVYNECLRPFYHLLQNCTIVLGSMGDQKLTHLGFIQNTFMYSVPRHKFWLDVLHLILNDERDHPPGEYAGSRILAEAVTYYRKKHPKANDITVYPAKLFNPFSWQLSQFEACKDLDRMSDTELNDCRQLFRKTSYVVQYRAHT